MRKINDSELIQLLKEGQMTQKEIARHFGCSEPAITKMKKRYKRLGLYDEFAVPESFKALSEKEQKFVLARVEGKNQTRAAAEAFDCWSDASARSMGSQLAKRDDIQKAVSELMWEEGLTRRNRVKILKEHVYAKDPNVSLKALDQTWKLDGAYIEKHLNVNISYQDMERELEELDQERKQLENELGLHRDDSKGEGQFIS